MKKLLLSLFCCLFFISSRAQWVSIPDPAFGRWLTSKYPSCMQGNSQIGFQMDTTCYYVVTTTSIDCSNNFINQLDGICYFTACKSLNCYSNLIAALPKLPPNLTYLGCGDNLISTLSNIPNSLTTLYCYKNQLSSLNSLPNSLVELNCRQNNISTFFTLPDSLKYLECSNNGITVIKELPVKLETLNCSYNKLDSLPLLPLSLLNLKCDSNQIVSLPTLPPNLNTLSCTLNKLDSLPILPSTLLELSFAYNNLSYLPTLPNSLIILWCSYNKITNIPILPDSLQLLSCRWQPLHKLPKLPNRLLNLYCNGCSLDSLPILPLSLNIIDCSDNNLFSLPNLPTGLISLICGFNKISDLPYLPSTLIQLDCTGNPNLSCLPNRIDSIWALGITATNIHCMPNRFPCSYFDINPNTLPLCDPLSGCGSFYNIAGNVHQDTSVNCTEDSLHSGNGFSNIKLQLSANGQVVQQTYAYSLGEYSFMTDSNANYTLNIDTTTLPFSIVCPTTGNRSVLLSPTDTVFTHQDFGLQCKGADVGVQSIYGRFRAARNSEVFISAGDIAKLVYDVNCAIAISGTVTTTFTGVVQYVSPASGALTPVVSGNTLTYTVNDFSQLSANAFNIILATDTYAVLGSNVCITTLVSITAPDINFANNTLTICYPVVNSLDPNLKEVYPKIISQSGDWLTYTIHFQNTGNDTAYNVFLRDTLSTSLNAETFQYLASSNKAGIQLNGNQLLFTFSNINLPDSATNPEGSEGWVQFRIKTKKNLPSEFVINNRAAIYFDLNPAIYTNLASTGVVNGIEATSVLNFKLFPNPNNGQFTIVLQDGFNGSKLFITDILGRIVTDQILTNPQETITLSESQSGIYFVTLIKGNFKKTERVVVY